MQQEAAIDDGDDASLSLSGNKPPLTPNRHGGGMIVRQKPRKEAAIDLQRARDRERKACSRANQTDEKRAAESDCGSTNGNVSSDGKSKGRGGGKKSEQESRRRKSPSAPSQMTDNTVKRNTRISLNVVPVDRKKWPENAFDLETIVRALHPTTDLCIYRIDKACDDDAEVFFIDAPTIALARYGNDTDEEVNKLGITISQYWSTCVEPFC